MGGWVGGVGQVKGRRRAGAASHLPRMAWHGARAAPGGPCWASTHTPPHTQPDTQPLDALDAAVGVELNVPDARLHAHLAAARCNRSNRRQNRPGRRRADGQTADGRSLRTLAHSWVHGCVYLYAPTTRHRQLCTQAVECNKNNEASSEGTPPTGDVLHNRLAQALGRRAVQEGHLAAVLLLRAAGGRSWAGREVSGVVLDRGWVLP